ncbi:related to conserved coiled/coiled coil protein [Cephalotrichum gorgonifer]|uniref:Related to conserved coiled/coiled coil protein n=1 Tax=Cephalotrichum gorgonifer TaxID=2041049 RepID=A0AAE8MSE9_9PEZI|nr:related to conserved coiled/coiled coil protein [Cephalotrichum gorgonifer]
MAVDKIVSEPSLGAVLQVAGHARDEAAGLLDLLTSVLEAEDGSSLTPEAQSNVLKQQKRMFTNIAQLRGLHRAANLSARDTKGVTTEARHEVDRLHLQLENLYYEQRHLRNEILACESYDHTYTQLDLIPVEEFLAQHPEHADADENALTVARIDHERAEREALEQQRHKLLLHKNKLMADNKTRKNELAKLDTDLEKFIDAAKPIQMRLEKVV